jgi:hypothetical protein
MRRSTAGGHPKFKSDMNKLMDAIEEINPDRMCGLFCWGRLDTTEASAQRGKSNRTTIPLLRKWRKPNGLMNCRLAACALSGMDKDGRL